MADVFFLTGATGFLGTMLAVDLPRSVFLPGGILSEAGLLYNKKENGREKSFITNMLTLMPYFSGRQEFDRTNTDDICGTYTLKWQDYIDRLLKFACRKNFMRQTGQIDALVTDARIVTFSVGQEIRRF